MVDARAQDATEDLKRIAVEAASAIVSINGNFVSNYGLTVPAPAEVRDRNKSQLIELLKSMKVSDEQIQKVIVADRDGVVMTYGTTLGQMLEALALAKKDQVLYQTIASSVEKKAFSNPKAIEDFMAVNKLHDVVIEGLLEDFKLL